MSKNIVVERGAEQLLHKFDRNVFKLYDNDATQRRLLWDQNVVKMNQRRPPPELANSTAMVLNYDQQQRGAIGS